MNFKKILCVLLSAVMLFALAACENAETESSEVSEASGSSLVSELSEPESSTFVPATDLIPSSEISEESADFYALFSQNPIDKQYDADYAAATSFGMMRQACDEAAQRWRDMVDVAYDAALERVTGEDSTALQAEQSDWSMNTEAELEAISEKYGENNDGILSTAKETVLYYRSRAMTLCEIVYSFTGELPSFDGVV